MNAPASLKYTKSDEWFNPETGAMGLSDYAQSQLSDSQTARITARRALGTSWASAR